MIKPADRTADLGSETSFAVSAEAGEWAARGNRVYPFHLGELNFRTPAAIAAAAEKAIRDGRTKYTAPAGLPVLRETLAEHIAATRGVSYGPENTVIQPAGKPVLIKFLLAFMNPGDEVLYPDPGFPIYSSLIEYLGGRAVPYTYIKTAGGFAADLDGLEEAVTGRTRIIIYNDMHNPTGADASDEELRRLGRIAVERDLAVLSDEAYYGVRYEGRDRSIVAEPGLAERTVILFTFSKRFNMTGWRLGAAAGPAEAMDIIARLNVNVESCSNEFVQLAAVEALTGRHPELDDMLDALRRRRDAAADLLNSMPGVDCSRPRCSFYAYPDVSEAMQLMKMRELEEFRRDILYSTGVAFCTRLHFGSGLPGETGRHLRAAFSGIDEGDLVEGLTRMKEHLESRIK